MTHRHTQFSLREGDSHHDSHEPASSPRGKVYLIGAGPGDPELITMKGLRRLREAEGVHVAGDRVDLTRHRWRPDRARRRRRSRGAVL